MVVSSPPHLTFYFLSEPHTSSVRLLLLRPVAQADQASADTCRVKTLERGPDLALPRLQESMKSPYPFHLKALSIPVSIDRPVLGLLLPKDNNSLSQLECDGGRAPVGEDGVCPSLRFVQQLGVTLDHQHHCMSLDSFRALRTLALRSMPWKHPSHWMLTPNIVQRTLATLPPWANLTRLSLPIGLIVNLQDIPTLFDLSFARHLEAIELPHMSRTVVESKSARSRLPVGVRRSLSPCYLPWRPYSVVNHNELALVCPHHFDRLPQTPCPDSFYKDKSSVRNEAR